MRGRERSERALVCVLYTICMYFSPLQAVGRGELVGV